MNEYSDLSGEITRQLISLKKGDDQAYEKLYELVYDHLRAIAMRELNKEYGPITLNKTDLVHESFIRMIQQSTIDWQDRRHFFGISARAMRQILVDYARKKKAVKRGGNAAHHTLNEEVVSDGSGDDEIIGISEGLEKLRQVNERLAEVVDLRFFMGLQMEEIAEVMGSSRSTVQRDWLKARAWLYSYLQEQVKN
ncbi:MAG: sigma-70 family RNA polymerase sigma factor [Balneolales bacterium]|nr:sigma-70 family RNA polymerase sigma factor [Balneolales bacterium]